MTSYLCMTNSKPWLTTITQKPIYENDSLMRTQTMANNTVMNIATSAKMTVIYERDERNQNCWDRYMKRSLLEKKRVRVPKDNEMSELKPFIESFIHFNAFRLRVNNRDIEEIEADYDKLASQYESHKTHPRGRPLTETNTWETLHEDEQIWIKLVAREFTALRGIDKFCVREKDFERLPDGSIRVFRGKGLLTFIKEDLINE